jgi:gliding motility-associated-like protein
MMTVQTVRPAALRRFACGVLAFTCAKAALTQGIANFQASKTGGCSILNEVITNTSTGFSSKAVYTWDLGNGTSATTYSVNTPVNATYPTSKDYTVTLTVTDHSRITVKTGVIHMEGAPTANFTISTYGGCLPLADTFTSTSSLGGSASARYFWDFGDGTTLSTTDTRVNHTFRSAGSTYVQLTVVNDLQCASNMRKTGQIQFSADCQGDSSTVPLGHVTEVSYSYTSAYVIDSICLPQVFYFKGRANAVSRLHWDFGDGASTEGETAPSHTYNVPGKYYVTLMASGADATEATFRDSVIAFGPSATVRTNLPQLCNPGEITLHASVFMPSKFSFSWNFGDGTVYSHPDTIVSHTYKTAGQFRPTLVLSDSLGCAGVYYPSAPIVVDTLHANLAASQWHVCDTALVSFTAGASSYSSTLLSEPISYHWNFGTGNPADTAATATPAFLYHTTGKYPVQLTVRSTPGCVYQQTDTLQVTGSARGTITGPASVCADAPADFAAVAPPGTQPGWAWLLPGGKTATGTQATVTLTAGQYPVTLVAGWNGCYDTTRTYLTVNPLPAIDLAASAAHLCLGQGVTLTAHDGVSYHWSGGQTTAVVTAQPGETTTYRVVVVNQFGCTASDSTSVLVMRPFVLDMPRDTFTCLGTPITLAPLGGDLYHWTEGVATADSTASSVTENPSADTVLTVVASDRYYCFSDTAVTRVAVKPLPTVHAMDAQQIIAGESVTLQASASSDVTTWRWSPGTALNCDDCAAPLATPLESTDFVVDVRTPYGCSASDSVHVQLICKDDGVAIPGAFTPNSDGHNDVFYPMGRGVRIVSSLKIFGRWGNLVYERHDFPLGDATTGWDGRAGGVDQPTGAYIYEFVFICDAGDYFTKKGTVLLER